MPAPARPRPTRPSRERVPSGKKVRIPARSTLAERIIALRSRRPRRTGMHWNWWNTQAKNGFLKKFSAAAAFQGASSGLNIFSGKKR